jgi:hypothetical protein
VSFSESSNRGPNKAYFKRNLAKVGHQEDYEVIGLIIACFSGIFVADIN